MNITRKLPQSLSTCNYLAGSHSGFAYEFVSGGKFLSTIRNCLSTL
uniref:Uncharacterized protein n=1 Tax=Rhizophora mucronata TaxID=61149 RepID=A0A2P2NHB6_RHIMU